MMPLHNLRLLAVLALKI